MNPRPFERSGRAPLRARPATTPFKNAWYYFAAALGIVFFGFWRSYFSVLETARPTIHVHAALSVLWLVGLIAQAWLIRAGQLRWHRLLGKASYVVAPMIVGFGLLVTREAAVRAGGPLSADSLKQITLPLYGMFQFVLAYSLAIAFRRQVQLHARLMIATAVPLLSAAILRIIPLWEPAFAVHGHILVSETIFLVLTLNDWRLGRIRAPFPAFLVVVALWHPLYELAPTLTGWLAIADFSQ